MQNLHSTCTDTDQSISANKQRHINSHKYKIYEHKLGKNILPNNKYASISLYQELSQDQSTDIFLELVFL